MPETFGEQWACSEHRAEIMSEWVQKAAEQRHSDR